MKRLAISWLGLACLLCGCGTEQFRPQPLGKVSYDDAFNSAKAVMGQYFSIASADRDSGRIVSRPSATTDTPARLLSKEATRKTATIRIRHGDDNEIVADIRVDVEKQDTAASRSMQPITTGNEIGNNTPAQESAAATIEQQQAWQNVGRDSAMENAMITDLIHRLEPAK